MGFQTKILFKFDPPKFEIQLNCPEISNKNNFQSNWISSLGG